MYTDKRQTDKYINRIKDEWMVGLKARNNECPLEQCCQDNHLYFFGCRNYMHNKLKPYIRNARNSGAKPQFFWIGLSGKCFFMYF